MTTTNQGSIQIRVQDDPEQTQQMHYEKRSDGWYVNDGSSDGSATVSATHFAAPEANERDVRQLMRKEYDVRY